MRTGALLSVCILAVCHLHAQELPAAAQSVTRDFTEMPEVKWLFKINRPIYASPVVSENIVYVGALDSVFYAIDGSIGRKKWSFHTNGQIRADACVSGETLYVNGGDGVLYALHKATGKLLWKFNTHGERKYDFADYFQSTPIIENGILYVGSGDGNLYAVNAATGKQVWNFTTGSVIHTKPAISNNKIFFGSFDGYVYALDIRTGKQLWKFKTVGHHYFPTGEVEGAPFVFNGLVFVGVRDYNVYAIDQEKGFCHWNKAFARGWALNNTVHDSILYISSADERVLIAADPATGHEYWKKNMEFLVFGNNAYSEGMLYLGTTIGKLHGINLQSGEKAWSFETDSYKEHKAKYFKPDDSYRDDIYSIIRSNEQFLDVECELGGIFSAPYVSRDNIIFTSTNGIVYCLKRRSS